MSIDALTSSGIDSMISAFKLNESQNRVTPLSTRRSRFQNVLSKFGVVSSRLDSLNSLLTNFKDSTSSVYTTRKATSSNTSFISVSATSDASIAGYALRVDQLAKKDLLVSNSVSSSGSLGLEAGTFTINVKIGETDKDVDVILDGTETNSSLMEKLRNALNNDEDVKKVMNAAVFTPTSGNSRISFTSLNSGSDNKIELSDKTGNLLQSIGITSDLKTDRTQFSSTDAGYQNTSVSNLNSIMQFNGIEITRQTNSISDLVTGVTFTLNSVMQSSDKEVNIDVKNDSTDFKSKIQEFVTKFNDVYSYIRNNTQSTKEGIRGDLINDPTANAVMSSLRSIINKSFEGMDSGVSSLSDIGISFSAINGLSVDSSKLDEKLEKNLDSVKKLFSSETGVSNFLAESIKPALGSSGYIANVQNSINSDISRLSERITSTNERIDKSADVLRKQYMQLQLQMASLINTQASFLNSLNTSGFGF